MGAFPCTVARGNILAILAALTAAAGAAAQSAPSTPGAELRSAPPDITQRAAESLARRDSGRRGADGAPLRLVRVGLYENPPKVFTDGNGAAAGIFPGLLGEIAQREGWELAYVPCEWAGCLKALAEGRIDLMPDMAWSRERDTAFDFHSTAALESWSQVYARPGQTAATLSSLVGARIALLKGAIQLETFRQMMDGFGYAVTIVPVETYEEGFRLAGRGAADAVVANHFVGDRLFAKYGLAKTPIVFQPASLYFATAQGRNADLLAAIDRHLNAWRAEPNSPYYQTLARWMERPPEPIVPRRLVWGLGVTAGALVLAASLAFLLQAQVRARTRGLAEANRALRLKEDELRRLNDELEERVRRRTAQLEDANRELDAFAYSVSHDLRAPLRAIDGYTQAFVEDYGRSLGAEAQRLCDTVREGVARMGRLIDDLLAFSRLTRATMAPSLINMDTMVRNVFDELVPASDRARIVLDVHDLPPATADPSLLRQVWANLLGNAVKFSSKRPQAHVRVRGEQKGEEIVYSVQDNGVGFDMQYAGRLFGVFQRLHPESQFPGTGVGLALVQRIVHRHGGRVWAEGQVGHGATFFFSLPQKRA